MARPTLIYDGDCGFCRKWVNRWRGCTGDAVDYVPSQQAGRFGLPKERLAEAVAFVEGGKASWGAEAVFRALAHRPYAGLPLALYRRVPPFARASEACYGVVARNRMFFSRVTRLLWGEDLEVPTYRAATRLFLGALALCFFFAYVSLAGQASGLVGPDGILPAEHGALSLPLWCRLGAALAAVALVAPFGPLYLLLWFGYVLAVDAGRDFLTFQWDILLLEAGAIGVVLAPWLPRRGAPAEPPRAALWLLRWLLFRLMLESGAVKLLSGDPSWRNLTALTFHYQTQPLPTWVGWWAQQAPAGFHKLSAAFMFAIELGAPWLIFLPRRPRLAAFGLFVALQLLIALTGNYGFFNFLALALCLPLLDDAVLRKPRIAAGPPAAKARSYAAIALACYAFFVGGLQLAAMAGARPSVPGPLRAALSALEPFQLTNGYGLFAVMTTKRYEISVEGTDGKEWREYLFKYKPGPVGRRPGFVAPHMPRLDWLMWFAALGPCEASPWFTGLYARLLQNKPEVRALLANDPFPEAPPVAVRSTLYEYKFSTPAQRRATGAWWTREALGPFCPPAALRPRPR